MPILDEQRYPNRGPYVDFADLPEPLTLAEYEWPSLETYQAHIFFRFSNPLCDAVCSATRTYLPFNPHGLTQLRRSYEILQLSAEFLTRAHILALTPDFYFRDLSAWELPSDAALCPSAKPSSIHRDLLDTLMFLSQRLHDIAFSNRCVMIIGY